MSDPLTRRLAERKSERQPGEIALPEISDVQLLQRIQSSDSTAMTVLYERYGQTVYRAALRNLCNPTEAEDLTQEVFLYLYQKGKDRYDAYRGSLRSYLLVLGRSRACDRQRQRLSEYRRTERWRLQALVPAAATPLEMLALSEHCHWVQLALGRLCTTEREVLELAYFGGHTQAEIAERLGLPLGTVKSRVRRGLRKLRISLDPLAR